ncbi:MAG: ATP-binding protein [Syntrophomonadaceae bacterium]|nr:ATP-binding protein [Syntrophomonadaceae bacterium]MDD3023557.1 ATP-binding protein [Syntrophomonadaceae bacterium]
MRDTDKTKEQLVTELLLLRQKVIKLEESKTKLLENEIANPKELQAPSEMFNSLINNKEIEKELRQFQVILEEIVTFRTEELSIANKDLQEQIARRQHVEEELQLERSRLFSVLDRLPALVYLIAPDFSFSFANRLFQEHFGKIQGRLCYEVFRGRSTPCIGCSTFKGDHQPIEAHIGEWFYPDGHTYEFYDYPFTDVDGSQLLLSFGLDITERKEAENALRLSEERFSKAFNASPISIAISSMEDGRFIDANEGFCQTIGFTKENLLGKKSMDIGFWVDIDQRKMIVQKLLNKESIRDMEVMFCRSDGEHRAALLSIEIININSEPQPCLLNLLTDITERRHMEIELLRLDRLNLVGEMAASIGHEIRNPMTTVRGFLQILSGKAEYINDQDYFQLMIEELDRANAIITEFLSLARNKMLELRSMNLNSLISSIFPLIQANAMIQDKEISIAINGEIPDLMLDEKEIKQLIHNLVHNALDATAPGGKILLNLYKEDEYVVLSIEDHGAGIDIKILDKIGTPFFSTKEDGTGLGLAVCYGIADRHGATIDIETGTEGSKFMVIFPIARY